MDCKLVTAYKEYGDSSEEFKNALQNIKGITEPATGEASTQSSSAAASSSNSFYGYFWGTSSNSGPSSQHPELKRINDEDLLVMYKFFEWLKYLKISPVQDNRIPPHANTASESSISLALEMFKSLIGIEFSGVALSTIVISSINTSQLKTLIIKRILSANPSNISADILLNSFCIKDSRVPISTCEFLNISFNSISELFLESETLARISNVKSIDLSNNSFRVIPQSILKLDHVQYLNLSCNKLTNCNFSLLHQSASPLPSIFTNIKVLSLKKNEIEVLNGLEVLSSLRNLDISDNNISEVYELSRLVLISTLTSLEISGNPFTKLVSCFTILLYFLLNIY